MADGAIERAYKTLQQMADKITTTPDPTKLCEDLSSLSTAEAKTVYDLICYHYKLYGGKNTIGNASYPYKKMEDTKVGLKVCLEELPSKLRIILRVYADNIRD